MVDNYRVVRPEHLNHHGYLFGGIVLKWVDEFAWLFCSLDYRGCTMVTVAMDEVQFRARISCGAIVRFNVEREKQGTTSVTYRVRVYGDEPGGTEEKFIFETKVVFVRLDENGRKTPLPEPDAHSLTVGG